MFSESKYNAFGQEKGGSSDYLSEMVRLVVRKRPVLLSYREDCQNAFVYDPEDLGEFLNLHFPKSLQENDFQDYPFWRQFNFMLC